MDHSGHVKKLHTIRWVKGDLTVQDVTGETPAISEYMDFGFYDHVSYK